MAGDETRGDITGLLIAWRSGDSAALGDLMPATYRKLKAVAARLLRAESGQQSYETTALVHEAYLRLVDLGGIGWQDRAHFYAMSARLMRQILVDDARSRMRSKRGSQIPRVSIDDVDPPIEDKPAPDLVALDDALRDLAAIDAERARIVELRFFGGLGRDEIAEVLDISSATVSRRWRAARAWLLHYLEREER